MTPPRKADDDGPKVAAMVWSGNPEGRAALVPIDQLRPDPENANDHSDPRSVAAIMASLMEYGQQKPTVHDTDGVMVAGNGTLDAAARLGWTHVWSVQTPLEGHQRDGFAIADNESARFARAHPEKTAALLTRIREQGGNVDATGYGDGRMEDLLASIAAGDTPTPGAAPGAGQSTCPSCGAVLQRGIT